MGSLTVTTRRSNMRCQEGETERGYVGAVSTIPQFSVDLTLPKNKLYYKNERKFKHFKVTRRAL